MKPVRALISVYDKTGIVELARMLNVAGIEILSTSKTAQLLRGSSVPVTEVAEFTGAPEILGGRVKTLHPKIFAGILSFRGEPEIPTIDIVVVNLYPFEASLKRDLTRDEMIELVDIGGVSLLRAAAKNCEHVAVVPDPKYYGVVIEQMRAYGSVEPDTRKQLAAHAFALVAHYDAVIANYFQAEFKLPEMGEFLTPSLVKGMTLRYGENPHQKGFYYANPQGGLVIEQCWGKELSFNNILDIDSVLALLAGFSRSVCAIVKHNTPCGVALHDQQSAAYQSALECDSKSAFGGIVGFNRRLEAATAAELVKPFYEVIVAPEIEPAAMEVLKGKKNLRVVAFSGKPAGIQLRTALSGALVQDADIQPERFDDWMIASRRRPSPNELRDLRFAWAVAKHVRSNAIVLARDEMTVGIGAGQMSRVDSVEIAVKKSELRCTGSVMASDGFFPFRDSIDIAAAHGITAVVEPGGSVRDDEVIRAADEQNMALVFTGRRHFRH